MRPGSGTPQLSIIIPCHNAAAVLGLQLDALTRQTWRYPWEIVLVDNCSTDALTDVVLRYRDYLPQLRVITAPARKSQAYALNTGMAQARSDAIALCDADDEVAPGWVKAMGEALLEHEAVAGSHRHTETQSDLVGGHFWTSSSARGPTNKFLSSLFPPCGKRQFRDPSSDPPCDRRL